MLAAAPFRIPVDLGSQHAFLLLPLYLVLAGAVLALALPGTSRSEPAARVPAALAFPLRGASSPAHRSRSSGRATSSRDRSSSPSSSSRSPRSSPSSRARRSPRGCRGLSPSRSSGSPPSSPRSGSGRPGRDTLVLRPGPRGRERVHDVLPRDVAVQGSEHLRAPSRARDRRSPRPALARHGSALARGRTRRVPVRRPLLLVLAVEHGRPLRATFALQCSCSRTAGLRLARGRVRRVAAIVGGAGFATQSSRAAPQGVTSGRSRLVAVTIDGSVTIPSSASDRQPAARERTRRRAKDAQTERLAHDAADRRSPSSGSIGFVALPCSPRGGGVGAPARDAQRRLLGLGLAASSSARSSTRSSTQASSRIRSPGASSGSRPRRCRCSPGRSRPWPGSRSSRASAARRLVGRRSDPADGSARGLPEACGNAFSSSLRSSCSSSCGLAVAFVVVTTRKPPSGARHRR